MKPKLKYILFSLIFSLFAIANVNAASTDGKWIFDYCTYEYSGDSVIVNSCNFSSATTLTELVVPNKAYSTENNAEYKVVVNGQLFKGSNKLKKVTFKTGSQIDNGERLFEGNDTIETIIFENGVLTPNLTSLLRAFTNCSKLSKIDFGNLDVSKVENFGSMFQTANSLRYLDLSALNNAKATNMEGFINSGVLSEIKLGKNFNFYLDSAANGAPFGRGTWRRVEDGKEFSAADIAMKTATEDISGTYKKISNVSYEISPKYLVTYSIDFIKPFKITNQSQDSQFRIVKNESAGRSTLYLKLNKVNDEFTVGNDEFVKLLLPDAVTDKDGNKYDLEATIDNIMLNNSVKQTSPTGEAYFEFATYINKDHTLQFSNNAISGYDENGDTDDFVSVLNPTGNTKYDVNFKVLDKDGNAVEGSYLFSAYDIDVPAYGDPNNRSLITPDYGYGDNSEGINLYKGGFDKGTFLKAKTYSSLVVTNDYSSDKLLRVTGSKPDVMSEISEFVIKANSSSAKIQFTFGRSAGIMVMSYYQPKIVRIENRNNFGEVLINSHFTLKNDLGEILEEWDTTDTPKSYFLNPGKYTITQVSVKDGYPLASDTIFYVDTLDKMVVNDKETESDLITIINTKEDDATVTEDPGKCRSEKIDGVWHYYDTKGNEITKAEWPNKCQDPVPTGSQIPFIAIGLGTLLFISTLVVVKKKTKLKRI